MIASIVVASIGLLMAGGALVYGYTVAPQRGFGRWVVCALCAFMAVEFAFMPLVHLFALRIGGTDEWIAMVALAVAMRYGVQVTFTGGQQP